MLGFKQCINYTFYFSKPCMAFKDCFTLQLSLGCYTVGKCTLVLFLFSFPLFFKCLLYFSPFALPILCFRQIYLLYIYFYNGCCHPLKFIPSSRPHQQLRFRLELVGYCGLYSIALPFNVLFCQPLPYPFYIGYGQFL